MIPQYSTSTLSPYLAQPLPRPYSNQRGLVEQAIDFTQVPSLLWHREFLTNHDAFYKKIQHIRDYLLMEGPSVYNHNNPNTPKCRSAYRGEIDPEDYKIADSFYGRPGSAKMRDFGFFHSVTQRHIGRALQEPLKFSYRDVSPSAVQQRMKAVATQMDEYSRRAMADAMAQAAEQAGQPADFSFLANPDIMVPEDGLFTPPTMSVEEIAGHALLVDAVKTYRVRDQFRQCREDAIQINARMAHIISDRRGTRPVRVDPDYVHWIAPGAIRTDADCDVIGTWDYPSVTEVLNQDGHLFDDADSIRGLTRTVEELRDGRSFYYNPRQYYFNGETQVAQPGDRADQMLFPAMWQDKFYPNSDVLGRLNGESIGVLRHQIYFKMIRFLRCEVLLNGKRATPEKMTEWRMRNYEGDIDARFEPLDDDEAKKPGAYIQKIPIVNLWQARCYGHNKLVGVQRCTHVPQYPTPKIETRFPIVVHVSRKRSFVALGLDFKRMWDLLWNRIEEQLNLGGAENALLFDTAQVNLKESKALMWQAKKTAVIHYNSTKIQDRGNQMAQKHLSRVQLTSESSTINNMLSLAGLLKAVYEGMVGDPGQAGAYDSANKLRIVGNQQSEITTEFSYEGNLFENDVLQRTAEIQKTVLIGDEWADVSYGGASSGRVADSRAKRRPVYIPKSMKAVQPLVEVDNGLDLLNIRQKIENMAQQVLPSGGAAGIREFIRLLFEDDPYEALAIFDSGMSEVEKLEAANAQAAQKNAEMRNQVEAKKAQIPIETMRMRTEADLLIAHGKEQTKAAALDAKGELNDIDNQNQREQTMLEHELGTGGESFLEDQSAGNQAALQQQAAQLDPNNIYPENLFEED